MIDRRHIARRHIAALAVFTAAAFLGGCDQSREMLGLNREGPDEFAVYSRAPLSVPPDFTLRPPAPGQSRPVAEDPRADARQALVAGRGSPAGIVSDPAATPGLQALYSRTGADRVAPGVRDEINRETSILAEEDKSFTDRIMFLGQPTPYGTVVDPVKEAQRIQENQALGKPINQGEVPVMERKRKGLLEGVLR